MAIAVATPPVVRVSWGCRRCGHTGGVAQSTVPVEPRPGDPTWVLMVTQLRMKLVRLHHDRQGCWALPDDFLIGPYVS
jgi:hypothetical protein